LALVSFREDSSALSLSRLPLYKQGSKAGPPPSVNVARVLSVLSVWQRAHGCHAGCLQKTCRPSIA
jgi:hypothetical protein